MRMVSGCRHASGQGMVEYALIVGLLSVFVMGIMMSMGPAIEDMLSESVSDQMMGDARVGLSSVFYGQSSSTQTVAVWPAI